MNLKYWPENERPRDKLIHQGAAALSDTELVAIFLRTGVAGKNAVDLARELLGHFGSLNALFGAPLADIEAVPGLGPAKFAQLKAVEELSRRALLEQLKDRDILTTPDAVKAYLRLRLQRHEREVFLVIYVDAQNRVIADEELFSGTLTQTSVYPRVVVKQALDRRAAAVIFAHNHPSGLAEPSRADELLTRALRDALGLVDIQVLDHLVVGQGEAVSFAERGLI